MTPLAFKDWKLWQQGLREEVEPEPKSLGPEDPLGMQIDSLKNQLQELEAARQQDRIESAARQTELEKEIERLKNKIKDQASNPPPPPHPPPSPPPPPPEEDPPPGAENQSNPPEPDDLARFTILRRARSFDFYSRQARTDRRAYERAYQSYEQSKIAYLTHMRDQLKSNQNLSEEEIVGQLSVEEFKMQRQFAEKVRAIDEENYSQSIEAGGFRAARARFLKRWAEFSWKRKIAIGLVAGGGAAIASATLGLGLFGLAVGAGARASLSILNHSASIKNRAKVEYEHEVGRINRAEVRDRIDRTRNNLNGRRRSLLRLGGTSRAESDRYLQNLHERTSGYHSGELSRARRRNRIGLAIMGASVAAVGVGVAELAGIGLPRIPNIGGWGGGNHHGLGGGGSGGHYETLSVSHGNWHDTIWRHVQEHSQPGQNLNTNVQRVLNMNRQAILSDSASHGYHGNNLWEASRHLSQGFKFKVPTQY